MRSPSATAGTSEMAKTGEEKIVFAYSPDGVLGDGVPLVLLGVPAGAWDYMKDGKTHTLDLTKIGIPIMIALYGAPDHAAAMKVIESALASTGQAMLDLRREEFGIDVPAEKKPGPGGR